MLKKTYTYCFLLLSIVIAVSCSSQKKIIRKADATYENGEYAKALEYYEKLLETEESKYNQSVYQYRVAECYRMLNNSRKAEVAYRKAIKLKTREKEAQYWYGMMLLKNEKYKEAEEAFTIYKKSQPKDIRAENGILSCSLAVAWTEKPTRYIVDNIKAINSREHDFSPIYTTKDYSTIYFTSSRTQEGVKQSINQVSGMNFTDIFETRFDRKGNWTVPVKVQDTTINTEFDDGALSISPDGTNLYITLCKYELGKNIGCQIYNSSLKGGSWSASQKIEIVGDSISIGHPAISDDGLELYFSSRMKGGQGGSDIWKVQRVSESSPWGKPINLGPIINTPGDEMFPYIRSNGVLYFSSDGHPGMGGLDIFRAIKDDKGTWSIYNMQYPINSSQDDFGIIFQGNKEIGLFTSNRKGGRGEDDIYSFELPELQIAVKGKIIDASNKKPIADADITLIGSDGSLVTAQSKKDGTYSFKLQQYTDYIIIGSYQGFLKKKIKFTTNNVYDNTTFEHNLELITMNKPVEIPNIFYDFGKWTLNESSKQALEELSKLLEDNPNITIEIGAHTDMVGDSTANMNLSKKRAQAIIDYLSQQGYDSERLVAKGFGESRPVTVTEEIAKIDPLFTIGTVLSQDFILQLPKETQEKANQINRRTELKILSTDYIPKPEFFERQKKRNKK
ncbi:MAG TPA: OmpA family protein [Bacteroidales bacterium]|jgi:peptidoglycan-associated lipoprotein|nr:OmpA family protein [Bacteroidales bacterium]